MSDIKNRREEILRICAEHGGHNVRVFGSVLRGTQTPQSDIDLLVELDDDRSLLDRIAIKHNLEDLLHAKVDVVSPDALHWVIRDDVLKEARNI